MKIQTRTYDQDYVIGSVNDPGAGGLSLTFGRDVLGNLTQTQTGAVGNKYVYDGLNRLTGVNDLNNALIAAYTYDATGNRRSKQIGGSTQVYTYPVANHHLIDIAGTARTYDADGNTATIGINAQRFLYNDLGRMSELRNAGVSAKQYLYNARGERVRKYNGAIVAENQYTVYDEAGHILGDYDGNSIPGRIRELIWMDDLPVGVLSGTTGTLAYLEPDHLGTPRAAIDATRNVAIWKWPLLNDAFGESAPQTDPDGDSVAFDVPLRFPGQRADAESGLNYNYFRDYDSATGRAIESDPLGLRGGISTYGYVGGNPLSFSDPFGLTAYSQQQTQQFLQQAYCFSTSSRFVSSFHIAYYSTHDFDFGWNNHMQDTWNVGGQTMNAGEFGNYIAGYEGGAYDQYYSWTAGIFNGAEHDVEGAGYFFHMTGLTTAQNDPWDHTGMPFIKAGETAGRNAAKSGSRCGCDK